MDLDWLMQMADVSDKMSRDAAEDACFAKAVELLIGQCRPTAAEMLALTPECRTLWCSAALWVAARFELEALDDVDARRVRAIQRLAGTDAARDAAVRLSILRAEAQSGEGRRGV